MDWWIEHGLLSGERPEQDAWNHSGRETEHDALNYIRHLLDHGCVVHALKAPGDKLVMDEAAIAARFGLPKHR